MAFTSDKQIRFHHCDPAGIVFYPQYFVLMNELVEDWFDRRLQIRFSDLHQERRLGVPMGRVECDFLASSRIGDHLAFTLEVERLGNASFAIAVTARCADELRVRARLTLVLASLESRRSVAIPADMRAKMARDLAGAAPG
ncbi:4-hydroxybenzoyl-CoA thioesterase [Burkholderiales bacterium]|nr:4-hydroxybenzoyl-CoA thioesterase [Burkholderiales bacterium]